MPRKKKVVTDFSDEDEPPRTPTKNSIEAAFARITSPNKDQLLPTRSAKSPTVRRKNTVSQQSSPDATKTKPKSISSFFNTATQKQQAQLANNQKNSISPPLDLDEDIIRDSSDDNQQKAYTITSSVNKNRKKRKFSTLKSSSSDLPKFIDSSKPQSYGKSQLKNDEDSNSNSTRFSSRPWTDQYSPRNLDELVVHKRKVQEVHDSIINCVHGKSRSRLIVLKGPSGAGKTVTVKLISDALGLDIQEWRNPESSYGSTSSSTNQFEEFITSSYSYGALSFSNDEKHSVKSPDRKSIIVVEEFPNTYARNSSSLQGFRQAISRFLAMSTPSADEFFAPKSNSSSIYTPVIMIVSESLLTTSTALSDSFTAHRLLGPEILMHPGTTAIDFNPVAPTFMYKALELILQKESRVTGRRFVPGPGVLKHLAEVGDIRSATSSLEFFCLHEGKEEDWGGKVNFSKSKKINDGRPLTNMEKQSLQVVTQRENTLGIFHAVGRVLYNNRALPNPDQIVPIQPTYFPQYARPKVSEVKVEDLLNELGTDINMFIAGLHENYVLSCQGLDGEETLDSVNGCIDSMSEADILCPDRFNMSSSRSTWQATSNDTLRQDAISFSTVVHGCLFHLPHPVKRISPPQDYLSIRGKTYSRNTAFQMFYPTSARLWRKKDQIQEYVEQIKAFFLSSITSHKYQEFNRHGNYTKLSHSNEIASQIEENVMSRPLSIPELLLERLPVIYLIQKRRPGLINPPMAQNIRKIIHLGGLMSALAPEDDEGEQEEVVGELDHWTTDKPIDGVYNHKRPRNTVFLSKTDNKPIDIKKDIDNLVLSDDDIVDD